MRQPIEVRVYDEVLTVSSEEPPEHVRQAAARVDAKMREIAGRGRSLPGLTVAILTALNLASEYQKLARDHEELLAAIGRLADRLTGDDVDRKS